MSARLYAHCVVGLLLATSAARGGAAHPRKSETETGAAAQASVEKVLVRESVAPVDRRAELAEALANHPDSTLLRSQAGYVRDGETWRPFEEIDTAQVDERLSRYRRERQETPATAAGELALANWCRQNGLPVQERAHLFAVLELSPGDVSPSVWNRLGYQQVGNQWLSQAQLAEWRESNRRTMAALKRWGKRLEKLAEQMQGTPRQKEAASAALEKLATVEVIPAMEYTYCGKDETTAILAVDQFAKIREYEGTVALARQGAFSPWESVRKKAAEGLKSRRLEDFVPTLISLMATPAKSESTSAWYCLISRTGSVQFILASTYAVSRETENQFQVSVLNAVDFRLNAMMVQNIGTNILRLRNLYGIDLAARDRLMHDLTRSNADEALSSERQLEALNERTAKVNSRIVDLLSSVTGLSATQNPKTWWQWWSNYTDVDRVAAKTVVRVDEFERGDPSIMLQISPSCFAAGTPVWTARGLVPIETIRRGDLVLAKDIETGELAYRPVLKTTVRPPRELVRIRASDETIAATGGHRFWVSGEGWVKARDLRPQSLVHTATGNAAVSPAGKAPPEATYNLVVDDFHSYFVGRQALLVQDLPLPGSTNRIVPGLDRSARQVAADR